MFVIFWPSNFYTFEKVPLKHLDFLGIALVMLGTVLPVFIINQAAVKEYAWGSATTIAVLVLSGVLWIVLMLWQWQLSRNPRLSHIQPQLPFRLITARVLASVFMQVLQC